MGYKPSDSYCAEFCTQRFDTGAATNADSTPTATANKNGTDDGTFTLTVANIDTGRYKVTGTVPVGYAAGDVVNVTVSATVNSVAGKGVIDRFIVDSKRLADVTSGSGVVVTTNNDKTGYALSSAGVQAVWDALLTALTTAGSIGKKLKDWTLGTDSRALVSADVHSGGLTIAGYTGNTPQTGDAYARLGAPAGASISADVAANATTLAELNGLLGKHVGLRNTAYTGTNLTSYDICLYDTAGHATTNDGVTGLLHLYSVANTYDGSNNLTCSVTTRVS